MRLSLRSLRSAHVISASRVHERREKSFIIRDSCSCLLKFFIHDSDVLWENFSLREHVSINDHVLEAIKIIQTSIAFIIKTFFFDSRNLIIDTYEFISIAQDSIVIKIFILFYIIFFSFKVNSYYIYSLSSVHEKTRLNNIHLYINVFYFLSKYNLSCSWHFINFIKHYVLLQLLW